MKENQRFNYLDKLFQPSFRPALRQFVESTLSSPQIIELDPTTRCNYRCPECISANVTGQKEIPPERLKQLINEFQKAGVKAVIFIGGGEPLMHSDMPNPLIQAHSLGMEVGLTTNGSLIPRYIEAISENVSWTRVSVDAATSETYEKFRPSGIPNSFNRVIKGMEQLAKVKKGALGYCFLIMQRPDSLDELTNAGEIAEAARLAKEIGCNYFEFKPMVDLRHYLIPFSQEMSQVVVEQYEIAKQLEDDNFAVVAPKSIEFLQEHPNPAQPKDYERCAVMEFRTLVTPTGIYPCPYMRGREDKRMGSIDNTSFDSFWSSPERIQTMSKINPSRDCGFYCIRHLPNVALNHIRTMEEQGVRILDSIRETPDLEDPFF